MNLIQQTYRNVSWPLRCRQLQRHFLNRSIQDMSAFRSPGYMSATCGFGDSSRRLCILMYLIFAFFEIDCFAMLCKFLDLISDCFARLRHGGRLVAYHLAEAQESVGAYIHALICFWPHGCDVSHKRYGGFDWYTISTGSANRNLCHQRGQPCLVLIQSSSWS